METLTNIWHGLRNIFAWGMLFIGMILVAGAMEGSVGNTAMPGSFTLPIVVALVLFVAPLYFLRQWKLESGSARAIPTVAIILLPILVFCFMIYGQYKKTQSYFIWQEERLQEQYANVNIYYKKQYNVIPATVQAINSYNQQEEDVLNKLIGIKSAYESSNDLNTLVQTNNNFDKTVRTIQTNIVDYPTITSLPLYQELNTLVLESETEIATAKQAFNTTAREFNSFARAIPYSLIVESMVENTAITYMDNEISEEMKVGANSLLDTLE